MHFSRLYSKTFLAEEEMQALYAEAGRAHQMLHEKTGEGSAFTGWLDWPANFSQEEMRRIEEAARRIRNTSDLLIVIGIGGSYLGAKAVLEMLRPAFGKPDLEIVFAGQNFSGPYLSSLLEMAEKREVAVNVISKSGTTTEPAVAFRIFKQFLEKKYGKEGARSRIYVTTDLEKGALRALAEKEGYESFVIPDDIGGRYSVLTPVGLLPIAAAGISISEILRGAETARATFSEPDPAKNECYQYAIARNVLYRKGKSIEIFASYEERLHYLAEWWKQLYGESEGKDKKGIFPASVDFSTDLHSVGQYIQDGRRDLFETVLMVQEAEADVEIPPMQDNADGLDFLEGKTLSFVNQKAFLGTVLAHADGGVPCLVLTLERLDAFAVGYLMYFFEKACAISAYLLGVNPFDQPGVEAYKKNMFALLGKPGYEKEGEKLSKRIQEF